MNRLLMSVFLLAAAALPARAHFIWVLPAEGDLKAAHIIYSDNLKPDTDELLKKIAKADVFLRGPDGKTSDAKKSDGKQMFKVTTAEGPHIVGVVLHYGVSQHGDNPPVLLNYYAKGFTGIKPKARPDEKFVDNVLTKSWDKLPLEILPVFNGDPQWKVMWEGKPLADAEVFLYVPGKDKPVETKSDKNGLFTIDEPMGNGLYGIRARHIEKKEGELDGKKYKEVRHYATMVFPVDIGKGTSPKPTAAAKASDLPKGVGDAAATKLLAEARAARANWDHFPGFTADVTVNIEGQVTKGKVKVGPKGEVSLDMAEGAAAKWAKSQLSSVVGHRLSDGDLDTPCAFVDDVTDHPMGRAIHVLNDEFHSSYRVKDRQILIVNRQMPSFKFTISVMENKLNEEKKYLPSVYVVNTWELPSGVLKSSATYHQEWKRVGKFDLPAAVTVETATNGKLESRSITLTQLKLQ